jgi:hypothetical protein
MSKDLDKPFLYQINFNRRKFPEVCDALDEAKESKNGLAWYLRDLIERDIESKSGNAIVEVDQPAQMVVNVKPKSQPKIERSEKVELPDDNGGFI